MRLEDIMEADLSGPTRFAMHSVPGYGKTTLAAEFPGVIFEAAENGFPRDLPYKPKVLPRPESWNDFFDHVGFLTYEKHPFQTLAYDTADWMEPFIHRFVCERDSGRKTELNKGGNKLISIEDYGYGRGYTAAEEEFRRLIRALDTLQAKRGMHVVFLMHTQVKNFKNPSGPDFDQYVPKVDKRIAAVISEWVENFFFGFYDVEAAKLASESKAKGTSSGKRLLGTRATAAYDAKNRIDMKPVVELEDPRDLIPYLLGQRVEVRQWDRQDEPAPMREPERREERGTPSATGRVTDEKREDERIAKNFEKDAKRDFEPEQESRAERHARERDEQMAEQRKRNEKVEALERERAADEERERAAKAQSLKADTRKADDKKQTMAETNDRIAKLTKLLQRAGEVIGPDYRAKVERWTKGAKGDPEKIDAIIEDVEQTLNSAAPAA